MSGQPLRGYGQKRCPRTNLRHSAMSVRRTVAMSLGTGQKSRPIAASSLVFSLVLAIGAAIFPSATVAGTPAQLGQFDVYDPGLEFTPIHAALLRTGKVWLGAGSGNEKTNNQAGDFRSYTWLPGGNPVSEIDP